MRAAARLQRGVGPRESSALEPSGEEERLRPLVIVPDDVAAQLSVGQAALGRATVDVQLAFPDEPELDAPRTVARPREHGIEIARVIHVLPEKLARQRDLVSGMDGAILHGKQQGQHGHGDRSYLHPTFPI